MTHDEKLRRLRRAKELSGRHLVHAEGPRRPPQPGEPFQYPDYEDLDPYTQVSYRPGQPAFYVEDNLRRVYDAMGVKVGRGRKIPKSAKGVAEVEGVRFVLHEHVGHGSGRKSSKHRLYASCPVCGKDIPAGRMHQHATVHGVGKSRRRKTSGQGDR